MMNSDPSTQENENVFKNSEQSNYSKRTKRSVMKALKMSMIHVMAFVFSWTPYTVMATW